MEKKEKKMNCASCGSSETKIFTRSEKNLQVIIERCKDCDLLYMRDQPTLEEIGALYEKYEIPLQWEYGSDLYNQEIISIISKVVPAGASILEIACSYGKIISGLQKKGYRVKGVEPSAQACKYIRDNWDLPIYEGFVEGHLDTIQEPCKYDAIIALNVIEHLKDPYGTLKKLDTLLKPGGYVIIIVPDISLAMLIGWVRKLIRRRDPFFLNSGNNSPIAFTSPGHLYFFSRKTLALLCRRLGWEIVEHKHAPYVKFMKQASRYKDLVKPALYKFIRLIEKFGLPSNGLSWSQLVLARKSH